MVTIEEAAKIVGWYCGATPTKNKAKYIGIYTISGEKRAYVTSGPSSCEKCLMIHENNGLIKITEELLVILKLNFNETSNRNDERSRQVAAFLKEWNKKVDNNKGNKKHN